MLKQEDEDQMETPKKSTLITKDRSGRYPIDAKKRAMQALRNGTSIFLVAAKTGFTVKVLRRMACELQISIHVRHGTRSMAVYERYRERHRKVCELFLSNPELTYSEIAKKERMLYNTVRQIIADYGVRDLRRK